MHEMWPYPALEDPIVKTAKILTSSQVLDVLGLVKKYIDLRPEQGRVGLNEYKVAPKQRECTISWIPLPEVAPDVKWVYDMATDVVQNANAQFWQYDLTGYYDMFQCVRYEPGNHFEWHRDSGDKSLRPQRKLSFSLLLSDPSEYEGGDLQLFDGGPQTLTSKDAGTFIIFPSSVQHRVTPVTKGTRFALVGWACGPKLK